MSEKLYGFYSKKQEEVGGSSVYLTPDGREVVVTIVSHSEQWPLGGDRPIPEGMVYVGEVTRCMRQHVNGSIEMMPSRWHRAWPQNVANEPEHVRQWRAEFQRRMREFQNQMTAGDENGRSKT